jgi:hypothetical protein
LTSFTAIFLPEFGFFLGRLTETEHFDQFLSISELRKASISIRLRLPDRFHVPLLGWHQMVFNTTESVGLDIYEKAWEYLKSLHEVMPLA